MVRFLGRAIAVLGIFVVGIIEDCLTWLLAWNCAGQREIAVGLHFAPRMAVVDEVHAAGTARHQLVP